MDRKYMLMCDRCNKIPHSDNISDLIKSEGWYVGRITTTEPNRFPDVYCPECFDRKQKETDQFLSLHGATREDK